MVLHSSFNDAERATIPHSAITPAKPLPELPVSELESDSEPVATPLWSGFFPQPELHKADTLDQFHLLLRRHFVDRVYLSLLETRAAPPETTDRAPRYWIVLSATKSGADLLARLPFQSFGKGAFDDPLAEAATHLNVLRNRFKLLGYSTRDGLCSLRLSREVRDLRNVDEPCPPPAQSDEAPSAKVISPTPPPRSAPSENA